MPNSDRGIEIGAWMLEHGHRLVLKLTGGCYPKTVAGMKPVELHTVGRKSGKRYSTLLAAPVYEPNRLVVVASKGGHSDHPDWYKNLRANPDVEVTVDHHTMPMRARTATSAEKVELWPAVVKTYKGYAGYQRNTDRDIPWSSANRADLRRGANEPSIGASNADDAYKTEPLTCPAGTTAHLTIVIAASKNPSTEHNGYTTLAACTSHPTTTIAAAVRLALTTTRLSQ